MDVDQKTREVRLLVYGFAVIALSFGLLYRMFEIGVVQHSHYLALAQSQQRFGRN